MLSVVEKTWAKDYWSTCRMAGRVLVVLYALLSNANAIQNQLGCGQRLARHLCVAISIQQSEKMYVQFFQSEMPIVIQL